MSVTSETQTTSRLYSLVPGFVLAWLCHYANAGATRSFGRRSFYDLKDRLLRKYGEFCGHDMQEVTKKCWGDRWWNSYDGSVACGPTCLRCGGTGIYDRRWVRLQKWRWGRFEFHIPDGETRVRPESVQIVGLVQHPDYGLASREAELWLYLVTLQWSTWWKVLSSSFYCYPRLWPMCRLQKCATWLKIEASRKRCVCGRKFRTRGSGWQICPRCRKPGDERSSNDLPF